MSGEKTVNENLKQLADKLAAHPQYSENPQVRAIVDEYRGRLLDPALSAVEVPDLMKAIKGSLAEYSATGEDSIESILPGLRLREQYESQRSVALRSGLFGGFVKKDQIGIIAPPSLPVIKRMDAMYAMPGWKEVRKILLKNKEIIKEKSAQGFTKMLIVPFGYDLQTMAQKFKEKVRELDQLGINPDGTDNPEKGVFGAGGEKVEFNREDKYYPLYICEDWDENQLLYYPKKYTKEDHGGLSKDDAIKIKGAWQICFVEEMPVIPLEGEVIGGRKQIDRKGSCIEGQTKTPSIREVKEAMENTAGEAGMKQMEDPSKYRHERGMNPEQYLWMQLTSLLCKEKPILMDYENNEWRGIYLTECFNVSSLDVPVATWRGSYRRIYLGGNLPDDHVADWGGTVRLVGLDRDRPDLRNGSFGARSSVDIIK